MNILEVQDLCKTYGTGEAAVHALNHVSFLFIRGNLSPLLVNLALARVPC